MEIVTILYLVLIFITIYLYSLFLLIFFKNKKNLFQDSHDAKHLKSLTILIPAFNEEKTLGGTIESLLENNEKRDIILLYSNSIPEDIAFKQLLEKAKTIGIKTYYVITKTDGHIDEKMIKEKVVDYRQRIFYISGPEPAVTAFKKMLSQMKVKAIKTDYFPGYIGNH